jgi:hypothetical protein
VGLKDWSYRRNKFLHLYVHRIIWTPDKIKIALFMSPVSELMIRSKDVNHNGVGAMDCIDWLPLADIFRTFYFDKSIDLIDELEVINKSFMFL